jgi:amino acid adenylation domain-containing protein
MDQQIAYWRNALRGAPPCLELPLDRPRPPRQTYRGSRVSRGLSAQLTSDLKALAARESCTLFMVLLAAFDVLLARYSAQQDIVVGSPIAGRRRSDLEDLVGLFVNTLVLRNDLSGNPSFRELLQRVRRTALDAFANQDLPFEKLVEIMQPTRSLSHAPLFQVMFILQNAPWEAAKIRGLEVAPGEIAPGKTAKFDLTVSAVEFEQALWFNFEYNTDLFDAATIERMAEGLDNLLAGVAADADASIEALPLQSRQRSCQLLERGRAGAVGYARDATVHELVAKQMSRDPTAVAVECARERWSYAELNERADEIAGLLTRLGAARNVPVAICLERSPRLLAAVLGVLKSGAAYLPLDPRYPQSRIAFMLEDSGTTILLGEPDFRGRLDTFDGHVVTLDAEGRPHADTNGHIRTPAPLESTEPLAYLIYTSGSTGQPKGVRVPHRAVVNLLGSMARRPGLDSADRLLAVTTLCFDISVLELMLPLAVGATVVIAPAEQVTDGKALAALLRTARISVMQATPATWRLLVESGWTGQTGLKILCGGEALDLGLARELLTRGDSVWNMYGPTETTIWSTCGAVRSADQHVTVGRPIDNTTVYILDSSRQPVPVGVAGELFIGGDGVSCGYHRRPELNRDKFIHDPFSRDATAPIYATGDRARWRADGNIELLGRADTQVKLRGFRIELSEIEAALGQQPDIAQAAVALAGAPSGDARLVAYVVTRDDHFDRREARARLREQLPEYMVPALFVRIDALPLTPNGKLNRCELPAPVWEQTADQRAVAAATPLETVLAELFAEVLGTRAPGADESFFDLGGHSLLATQLVSRVRDRLRVELPLSAIFERRSVRGLADLLSNNELDARALELSRRREAAATLVPASYMQQRLWFLDRLQPGNPVYNLAWNIRLHGKLDTASVQGALTALVDRHETLRTAIVERDGMPMQDIAASLKVSLRIEEMPGGATAELDERLRAMALEPFSLANAPLLRATLLQLGPDDHVLSLVIHHIIADGWSMGVLFRDLCEFYNAACDGREPLLPELPVQYADYSLWQQGWLQGEELDRQLTHWRKSLSGAPNALTLPTARPRPAMQTYRGAHVSRFIPQRTVEMLEALGRSVDSTLFMVLLAAFDVVLARFAGQQDVVVGTPVAGRSRTELENLVGFFVNTLAMRTRLEGNPTFVELLARVRATVLGALAHQDVPFERVVDDLRPERDPARTPLFQVLFNLHNEPTRDWDLRGIEATRFGIDRDAAKFDLTASLTNSGGALRLDLEYNTDVLTKATVGQLASAYERMLHTVTADPHLRIGELELLPARSSVGSRRVAPDWVQQAGNVPTCFAQVLAADPKALAVQTAATKWSYGTLNGRANHLAHRLLQTSGGRARIGLMASQDAAMVAGILGVLKAGHAYVPLDPAYPPDRLSWLAADAELTAVVSASEHLAQARVLGLPVVEMGARAAAPTAPDPDLEIQPDALAYILYTSGSTGEPKGVMQTHAGLLTQIGRYAASLELAPTDRLSLLSGYGFDAAAQDIFGALLTGAAVLPVDMRAARGAVGVVDELVAARATVLHATPTVYRHLLGGDLRCEHDLSRIRLLVLGGEVARRADFELFKARFRPGARFVNGFGLTESTCALQFFGDHDTDLAGQIIPLGQPVPGMEVELQDMAGRPSWYGEIVLRGRGIATGYWNRPALTASQFGIDPADGQRRIYRTGDIARLLPDGQLAYVGRRDDQVKLRGFRIELGEIEATLSGHPDVEEGAAAVIEHLPGEGQLAAYLRPLPGAAPKAEELRAHCRRLLPDWMVPQAYVVLDQLPRLASGKLDRLRLPTPDRPACSAVPPRTELEAQLSKLWAELLKLDQVGIHDDFFLLGGHSLLATRLVSRIRARLDLEIPLVILFEHSTVARLADAIEAGTGGSTARPSAEVKPRRNTVRL